MNVAVVGVSGAVGQEFLKILESRNFPLNELVLFGSSRSAGKEYTFKKKTLVVKELKHNDDFKDIDIALVSAGGSASKEFAGTITKHGAVMIDNSSAFRMDPEVPLVVPEINPEDCKVRPKNIIANPNCSTIIMIVPLYPIYKAFGIERVHVATYQAASGAGAQVMQELIEETEAYIKGEQYQPSVIPFQYAFNLFPHNSPIDDSTYCTEETKMIKETHKIFHDNSIRVNAVCVRVPILRAHSEALNIQLRKEAEVCDLYKLLKKAPGVKIVEDRSKNQWPMPIDSSGQDPVLVGRIRKDVSQENTFDMWVVGDQLLKGAALNAVQIAEYMVKNRLL